MSATATTMRAANPAAWTRNLSRVKKAAADVNSLQMSEESKDDPLLSKSISPIAITETESQFRIAFPLNDVAARDVCVFATCCVVLIEVSIKNTVQHSGANCEEIQHLRVTREIRLHAPIKEGATTVRSLGTNLEIFCAKTVGAGDSGWSEFIAIDSRASIGCV